ncbi:MAG: hypothetical protein ABI209_06710 [Edaphobacter sp.]
MFVILREAEDLLLHLLRTCSFDLELFGPAALISNFFVCHPSRSGGPAVAFASDLQPRQKNKSQNYGIFLAPGKVIAKHHDNHPIHHKLTTIYHVKSAKKRRTPCKNALHRAKK